MEQGKDAHILEPIALDACRALLREHDVGRIAVAEPGCAPLVVPVNYRVDGGAIVFRSDVGEKTNALRHQPVSFEVDAIDPLHRSGWSVLVRGVAYEATHWEVDHVVLESWAPGAKGRWYRLVPHTMTGRRLRLVGTEGDEQRRPSR